MNWLYIVSGIISGTVAGMGMGGGTLLIPLLVLWLGVDVKVAGVTNLLCFIPLSVVSMLGLIKDKLVDFKMGILVGAPAMIFSILASYLSTEVHSEDMKVYFGVFLIVLGIVFAVKTVYTSVKRNVRYFQ
ncbi:MAG: sulfite exporter TauE/SafE family protein [Clostridia bacterium]|nr:sulfite exporter TauE/SafE family protein [Clostridia bacterium]MDY5263859.1 sulfite exporter TauE/SafE family protein [Eubacteriales bacterium]